MLYIRSDQSTATEGQIAQYGSVVVSEQAVAIGVTAIPTPVAVSGSDLWFVYETMVSDFTLGGGGLAAAGGSKIGESFPIDSRAMRKVEDGQDVVSVLENGSANGVVVTSF